MKILNLKLKIVSSLSILLLLGIFLHGQRVIKVDLASAFIMSNDSYIIEMGNLNSGSGKPSGSGKSLGFTTGQISPGLYTGDNYKVKAGFQYIHPLERFRFSISNTDLNFGILEPTNPVYRNNTLTILNRSAYGYAVTAYENHQLLVPASGALIPDTTCDGGTCTESTSALWSNVLTYGFGYRCDAVTVSECATGFSTADYYKQFADDSKGESPQTVMTGTDVGTNKQVKITYKINISGTQVAGEYSNQIIFIATPTI